jgi:hypothetical protein
VQSDAHIEQPELVFERFRHFWEGRAGSKALSNAAFDSIAMLTVLFYCFSLHGHQHFGDRRQLHV